MEFENLTAILDFAIQKEVEAAEFYTDISKDEVFSGAGEMFEEFAREERKHQQMLENFKTNAPGKIPPLSLSEIGKIDLTPTTPADSTSP